MAIYQYECTSCGHTFDDIVKMSDMDKKRPCPKCGKESERTDVIHKTVYSLNRSFSRMRHGK